MVDVPFTLMEYECGCPVPPITHPTRCPEHGKLINLDKIPMDRKKILYEMAKEIVVRAAGKNRPPIEQTMQSITDIMCLGYYWDVCETKPFIIEAWRGLDEVYQMSKRNVEAVVPIPDRSSEAACPEG